jgi:ERF superfamily
MSNGETNGAAPAGSSGGLGPYSSPELAALAAALSKAQGAFKPIVRSREVSVRMKAEKGGGTYTFKYAPLDEVIEATRPALAANGLAVVQLLVGDKLSTTLLHASGQWIASTIPLGERAGTLQDLGSKLTYLRRYALAGILGVAPEDDDDGRGGNGEEPAPRQVPRERIPEGTSAAPEGLDAVRTKAARKPPAAAPKSDAVASGRPEYLREVLVDAVQAGQAPNGAAVWSVTITRESGDQLVLVTFDAVVADAARELVGSVADVETVRKSKGDKSWIALERIRPQVQDEGSDASREVERGGVPF